MEARAAVRTAGSAAVAGSPAAAAKTSYTQAELMAYAYETPGTRRRLPTPPLLMFDRVARITTDGGRFGKGEMVAEKDVRFDEWFFQAHFRGDPVMPGILGVDALLQMGGFYLMHLGHDGHGRALRAAFRFEGEVRPHHRLLRYDLHVKKVVTKPQPTVFAEGDVACDGKPIYAVTEIMVGLFQNMEAYRYP
jgi:3-hydroxyacyl-[acyl-carrier protein] dehydratase/trans-2-decenoyl-[acyl-carrier protein] isomerase